MLTGVPNACHISRAFSKGDYKEARRQLPIWRHNIGRTVGSDCTVHLTKLAHGYAILVCGPDYKTKRKVSHR
jgi:hypothetical protein